MTEAFHPERAAEARYKTVDVHYEYRGTWSPGAVCRIRVYEQSGTPPVVIATELPENEGTSVTNMAEYLAAEIIQQHFPQRFEENEPIVWLEQYPALKDRRHRVSDKFEYDRVTFGSWAPRRVFLGGVERIALGEPAWHPLTLETLTELVGQDIAVEIMREGEEHDLDW